jgi:hypothetical protein
VDYFSSARQDRSSVYRESELMINFEINNYDFT